MSAIQDVHNPYMDYARFLRTFNFDKGRESNGISLEDFNKK